MSTNEAEENSSGLDHLSQHYSSPNEIFAIEHSDQFDKVDFTDVVNKLHAMKQAHMMTEEKKEDSHLEPLNKIPSFDAPNADSVRTPHVVHQHSHVHEADECEGENIHEKDTKHGKIRIDPKELELIAASKAGDLAKVEHLIRDHHVNINCIDHKENTPLIYGCIKGNIDLVILLVENGADTEHYGQFGYTALINACKGGHIEIVTVLIDWGANIEAISKTGYNCIYYASVRGHANVVQHLLLSGALVLTKDLGSFLMFSTDQLCEFIKVNFKLIRVLKKLRSPIKLLNRLKKVDDGNTESMLTEIFKDFLRYHPVIALENFLLLYSTLEEASAVSISESHDLSEFASKVELCIKEIFNADSMDVLENQLNVLDVSNNRIPKGDPLALRLYQAMCYEKHGLLKLAIDHNIKIFFGISKVAGLTAETLQIQKRKKNARKEKKKDKNVKSEDVEEILNDDNTPNEYEDNPSIQNTPKSVKVKELSFSPSSKNGKDKNYETLKESSHDDEPEFIRDVETIKNEVVSEVGKLERIISNQVGTVMREVESQVQHLAAVNDDNHEVKKHKKTHQADTILRTASDANLTEGEDVSPRLSRAHDNDELHHRRRRRALHKIDMNTISQSDLFLLSLHLRSTPVFMFYFDFASKIFFLFVVAVVSIGYGVEYGSDYDNYDLMKSPMSKSEILLVIMLFSHIFFELGQAYDEDFVDYITDNWNQLDIIEITLIGIWAIMRIFPTPVASVRLTLALAAIPQSFGLLQYVSGYKTLGLLIIMIRVMTLDFLIFIIVYVFSIFGFGIFFYSIFYDHSNYTTAFDALTTLFEFTLSNFDFSIYNTGNKTINSFGVILTIIFLLLTAIILLNLLIAHMTSAYEEVNARAFEEWSYVKAKNVDQYLLLKEHHVFCMLPPPLNLLPILVYPVHWYAKYYQLPFDNAEDGSRISVAGTICNLFLCYFCGWQVRVYATWLNLMPASTSRRVIHSFHWLLTFLFNLCLWPIFSLYYSMIYPIVHYKSLIQRIEHDGRMQYWNEFMADAKETIRRQSAIRNKLRVVSNRKASFSSKAGIVPQSTIISGEGLTDEERRTEGETDQEDDESVMFTSDDIKRICQPLLEDVDLHIRFDKLEEIFASAIEDLKTDIKSEVMRSIHLSQVALREELKADIAHIVQHEIHGGTWST